MASLRSVPVERVRPRLRFSVDRISLDDAPLDLSPAEQAVLRALSTRKVLSRTELAQAAHLEGRSSRRCDAILVVLRRQLPPGAIRNVRARGWILDLEVVEGASAGER
jgi:DNA-binding response OmpR family regulator